MKLATSSGLLERADRAREGIAHRSLKPSCLKRPQQFYNQRELMPTTYNARVAYGTKKRPLRHFSQADCINFRHKGAAQWLNLLKKDRPSGVTRQTPKNRWPGWPRWPLHEIAKWTAKLNGHLATAQKLIESLPPHTQSLQPRLRDIDFRLDKCDWPPGHREFTKGGWWSDSPRWPWWLPSFSEA